VTLRASRERRRGLDELFLAGAGFAAPLAAAVIDRAGSSAAGASSGAMAVLGDSDTIAADAVPLAFSALAAVLLFATCLASVASGDVFATLAATRTAAGADPWAAAVLVIARAGEGIGAVRTKTRAEIGIL
jgi:hypothetical protein